MLKRFKFLLVFCSLCSSSLALAQADVRVVARNGVVVRSNPTADASVVETLPSMAKVTVLEQLGSWLRVATASRVGYVRAGDLSAPSVVTPVTSVLESPLPAYHTNTGQVIAGYKDPGTATLFSLLITGGGHFYSGESKKGALLLGGGLGALVLGLTASGTSCEDLSCDTNATPLTLGLLAYVGTWVYGIMDAGDAARRHNTAVGLKTIGAIISVRQVASGRAGIGFSFATGR